MFEDNKQFEAFRDKLNARGVILRCMWEANAGTRRPKTKYADVALYAFIGDVQPGHHTAVLIDYGPDHGFGLYFQAPTNSIDDDVTRICGPA